LRCRDIDPVEDTERSLQQAFSRQGCLVAGISIRLRILKAKIAAAKTDMNTVVAGISIRLRILKVICIRLSSPGIDWLQGYRSG